MRKNIIKTNIIIAIILVVLASLLISSANANEFENNIDDTNKLEITLDGNEKTFIIDELDGIFSGYLEDEPEKKYLVSDGFNLTINYISNSENASSISEVEEKTINIDETKKSKAEEINETLFVNDKIDTASNIVVDNDIEYNFNLQLNYDGDIYFGNINANLEDELIEGFFNMQGTGKLHLEKPAIFGNNKINISEAQLFIKGMQLKAKTLSLMKQAHIEVDNVVGTGPSILVENLFLNNSSIMINAENGQGIQIKHLNEKNLDTLVFHVENKSTIEIFSGSDGIIIGNETATSSTDILDSTITIEGKHKVEQTIGLFSAQDINMVNAKINIKKHPNGITAKNLNATSSAVNIDTQQKSTSDVFGTGVYTSGAINMDTSDLNITSPLDIGYQNNVQAIWASEINLKQKSNIIENYVGTFNVSADEETDIYYNGGLGSQMMDIDNYEITTKNDSLVYNKKTKKFVSEATKQQSYELIFKRDETKSNEKINIEKTSSHKIVIPVSLETIAPYIVDFETNGGNSVPSQQVQHGEKATRPGNPLKEGFDFDDWYADINLSEKFDFNAEIKENISLYAAWKNALPRVIFDVNGGVFKEGIDNSVVLSDSSKIDISFYNTEENLPYKSGFYFAGWMTDSGSIADDTIMIGDKNITLIAKWEAYENLLNLEHSRPITEYKNSITENDINQRVNTFVKYMSVSGREVEIPVFYEWNTAIINVGGITEARPYILDQNTNEKIYGNNIYNIDIYILNKPYIRSRKDVMLSIKDKVAIDGREWQAVGVLELPDFSSKRITRTTFPVIYNGSQVNTFAEGVYDVYFSGHTSTISGESINVDSEGVTATVSKIDVESTRFWITAGEEIKNLKKNNFNAINLNTKEVKKETVLGKSDFDRSMIIKPDSQTVMLNGFLSNLTKHKNAMVRIDMEENQWDLYSKNFGDEFVAEKLDLSVKNTDIIDEDAVKHLSGLNYKALDFALGSNWGGEAVFRTKINFENNNVYMFSWNDYTKELELVGEMHKDNDGYYSIKLNYVSGKYIITNGLPKPIADEASPVEGNKVSSFRITDQTVALDESTFNKIKATAEEYGININYITLVQPKFGQFDDAINQEMKDRQIVAGILLTIVFILAIIVVINRILMSIKKKNLLVESASMGVATIVSPGISFGVRLEEEKIKKSKKVKEKLSDKTEAIKEDIEENEAPEEPYDDILTKVVKTKKNTNSIKTNRETLLEKNRNEYFTALEKISPELVESMNGIESSVQNGKCEESASALQTVIPIKKDEKQEAAEKTLKSKIKLGNKSENDKIVSINTEDAIVYNTQKSILARIQSDSLKKNIKVIKKDEIIEKNKDEIIEKSKDEIIEKSKDEIIEKSKDEIIEKSKDEIIEKSKDEIIEKSKDEIIEKNKDEIIEKSKDEIKTKPFIEKKEDKEVVEKLEIVNEANSSYYNDKDLKESNVSERHIKPKISEDKKTVQQRVYRRNSRLNYDEIKLTDSELGKIPPKKSRLVSSENPIENQDITNVDHENMVIDEIKKDKGHNIDKENSQESFKGKINLNLETEYQKNHEEIEDDLEIEIFKIDEDN